MIEKTERERIIALVKREVIPAIGCTEPVAVALCTARACEILGVQPTSIDVYLSANVLKNAMGVGIPGTGMSGLPIAIALGALIGKASYQLEVLKDVTPSDVERGKQLIDAKVIQISLKENTTEKLYIEVVCSAGSERATAVIAGGHTYFVYEAKGEQILLNRQQTSEQEETGSPELSFSKVYEFAMESPLEEIAFILESARLNKGAAEFALQKGKSYGHGLGKMLNEVHQQKMMGEGLFPVILSYTAAACDARMAGAMVPVMSNSGSGNQGIAATLPVVVYAEKSGVREEQLIRALMLSHLTVIYIKQSMGRLSALCGCVIAATGSSCGITYLMGGSYEQITYAVKNMIANLTGMVCDGAKPSCALKLTSGVSTALFSAMLAMENECVESVEGIIDDDVEKSIHNLVLIGSQGMNETDKLILEIMTHKCI